MPIASIVCGSSRLGVLLFVSAADANPIHATAINNKHIGNKIFMFIIITILIVFECAFAVHVSIKVNI